MFHMVFKYILFSSYISYLPLAHIYERTNQIISVYYGVAIGFYQGVCDSSEYHSFSISWSLWGHSSITYISVLNCRTIWNWWMTWLHWDLHYFVACLGCTTEYMPGNHSWLLLKSIVYYCSCGLHVISNSVHHRIANSVKTSGTLRERLFQTAYSSKKQSIMSGNIH